MYKFGIALYTLMVMILASGLSSAAPRLPGGAPGGQGSASEQQPLAQDEVMDLVQAGMDSAVLAKKVEKLGINFDPTDAYLESLRKAGAQDVLIEALRNAKPKPLSKEQVLKLLAGGVPLDRAVDLVKQFGIDFMADEKFIHLLRAAGADDRLIAAVRGAGKTPAGSPTAGTPRENARDGLRYVWIPAGTFMMGCSPGDNDCYDDEKPAHNVTLSNGFWMGQTEITVAAYKHFVAETGHAMPPEPKFDDRALNPGWNNNAMAAIDLNWASAQDYCTWAGGRLPTEAEWEYAARGGTTSPRYGDLDNVAWYANNSGKAPVDSLSLWKQDEKTYYQKLNDNGNGIHEVAKKPPNPYGLFDMLGNASEWVQDWYDEHYYQSSLSQDPPGPATGTKRVLRGYNWFSLPYSARVSSRGPTDPTSQGNACGARCMLPTMP